MYMGDYEYQEMGGLKKLVKKAGKALGKVAKVAVPVVAGVGGAVAGVKLGSAAVKMVSGGGGKKQSKALAEAEKDVANAQAKYPSFSVAQLQAERQRLVTKINSKSGDKLGSLAAKVAIIDQLLGQHGQNTTDQSTPESKNLAARQVKPRVRNQRVSNSSVQSAPNVPQQFEQGYSPSSNFMPANVSEPAPWTSNGGEEVLEEQFVTAQRPNNNALMYAGLGGLALLLLVRKRK